MNEPRDREVERLLREYKEDLRRENPPDLLARLHEEQRRVRPARVLRFPSRRVMGGLALAASLLVMVAVFRPRPATAPLPGLLAQESAAPGAEAVAPAVNGARRAAKPAAAPRLEAKTPEIPSPRPPGLASTAPLTAAPARTDAAGGVKAEAAPQLAAARMDAEADASKMAEAKRVSPAVAKDGPPVAKDGLTLVATVVQEVWEPGQLARVFESAYQRLADGREVRAVPTPADGPALAQNSVGLAAPAQQQQMPRQSAGGMALPRAQNQRLAPVRDPMAQARSRIASPSLTPLAEMVIEGYRCTGTRTVEGERTVDRWRSAELGLDLLTRTTDANGGQVVVRYTRIERR